MQNLHQTNVGVKIPNRASMVKSLVTETHRDKTVYAIYEQNDADQLADPHSLISAFNIRYLDSL